MFPFCGNMSCHTKNEILFDKARVVAKTLGIQVCLFVGLLVLVWGSQAFYGVIDTKKFPQAYTVGETANLSENDKGKLLVDSVTNQLRREMGSTFGWTMNDIVFNRFVLDNRAYRQYGVYHATRVLMDLYSTQIAKLGSNDRESRWRNTRSPWIPARAPTIAVLTTCTRP